MATFNPKRDARLGSRHAQVLHGDDGRMFFGAAFEAEYVRAHLLGNRTLIRATCVLATLLAVGRGAEQMLGRGLQALEVLGLAFVVASSIALAAVAWTRFFERMYLPLANVVVPLRNAVIAIFAATAVARGQHEMLMVLPLLVLGPFFFLGLRLRTALLSAGAALVCFAAAAAAFGLMLPLVLRASVLLVLTAAACAVATRQLEKGSRQRFLEGRLIEELAQHDALTGLKNRRVFDEALERRWEQAIEAGCAIAILLIDVDHFKAFNDLYGHQAGDRALRRVARALQALVYGPREVIARYGGEEFAVILYDVDAGAAEALAQRMRRAVGALGLEHAKSGAGAAVTISIGVALVAASSQRRSRGVLQLADQALYEAKMHGRDRVVLMDQAAHDLLETGVFAHTEVAHG